MINCKYIIYKTRYNESVYSLVASGRMRGVHDR